MNLVCYTHSVISTYTQIAFWSWPILFFVWLLGYFNTKKTLKRPEMGRYIWTTFLIALGFSLLFGINDTYPLNLLLTPHNAAFGILGDAVCVFGILVAVWARIALAGNWSGATATLKENHELIQRGPYRFVRHPIYTGFFFGMLGTALTLGILVAYLGVIVGLVAFLIRIQTEERLMSQEFPEYVSYKKNVKTLIPFIW